MHVYMDMAAAEDGTWDATAYRSGSPCLTPHYSGEDPIPAQGSLAPDTITTGVPHIKNYYNLQWKPTLRGHEGCFGAPRRTGRHSPSPTTPT